MSEPKVKVTSDETPVWVLPAVFCGTMLALFGMFCAVMAIDPCPPSHVAEAAKVIESIEPTPAIRIVGPTEAEPGALVELAAEGSSERWRWGASHDNVPLVADKDFKIYEGGVVVCFSTPKPGAYLFWLAGAEDLVPHVLTIGGQPPPVVVPPVVQPPVVTPDPTRRATRATYVYEQRRGSVPPPVAAALSKLNVAGVVASSIDQDVISGKGQAPAQYATALAEAKKAGLPCLVVEYTSGAPKVVAAPTTEAQVMEAVK